MRIWMAAIGAAVLLAPPGCGRIVEKFRPPAEFVPPERPNDSCNSAPFREYVGRSSDDLAGVFIPEPYRVLAEDAPATLDYNPARLNFVLGADGTVRDLSCG